MFALCGFESMLYSVELCYVSYVCSWAEWNCTQPKFTMIRDCERNFLTHSERALSYYWASRKQGLRLNIWYYGIFRLACNAFCLWNK